jgi:hypothetical protein
MMKKIRVSICGMYQITPSIDEESFIELLDDWGLNTEDSLFLPKKLRTKEGIFELLVEFNMIHRTCPNYFATVSPLEFAKVPYNANDQTTFCSLIYNKNTCCFEILQHNSYPMGTPTDVNYIDAILAQAKFEQDGNFTPVLTMCKQTSASGINKNSLGTYLTERALGIITNQSFIDDRDNTTPETHNYTNNKTNANPGKSKRPWTNRSKVLELDKKENKFNPKLHSLLGVLLQVVKDLQQLLTTGNDFILPLPAY